MHESSSPSRRAEALLLALVFLLLIVYDVGFLLRAFHALRWPLALDYGEGFLLGHAVDLARGTLPYQPVSPDRMVVCTYPIVFPGLASLFFLGGEASFFGPRLLSIFSTLGTALLALLFLRGRQVHWKWALLAPMVYLGTYHVVEWGVLARVDALALFLSALGLYLYDRTGRIVPALVCFSLAFLTRQTMLAGILAVAFVLWGQDEKRRAAGLLFAFALFQLTVLGALSLATGGQYFLHCVVYNANQMDWASLIGYFQHLLRLCGPLALLGIAFLVWNRQNRRVDLLAPLLVFAFLISLSAAKIGSAPNYFLELLWVLCVVGAQMLDEMERRRGENPILSPLAAALALVLALQLFHVPGTAYDYLSTPVQVEAARAVRARLAGVVRQADVEGNLVIASDASFHLAAGTRPALQPFIMTRLAAEGRWDAEMLWTRIRNGDAEWLILDFDPDHPGGSGILFPSEFPLMVRTLYEPAENFGYYTLWRHR